MNPFKIVIGFVPFILFTVLQSRTSVGWAAAGGLAAALVLVATTARGGLKILPVVQAVILAVLTVAGFGAGSSTDSFLATYGRGIASLALGLFIVATAASMPFTAQFARAEVPSTEWNSPSFLTINRRLSFAWGVAVLVLGATHALGAYLAGHGIDTLSRLVTWGAPIVAFVWVINYTRRIASQASPGPTGPAEAS